MNREERQSSRLILLDEHGRVLLFRHAREDGTTFWAPPGGGLEPGETFEEAALREAEEELGSRNFEVRLLWERWVDFVHIDHPVRQHECFFLLTGEIPPFSALPAKTHADEGIIETRWWTTSAIVQSTESVFSEGLAVELKKIST